MVLTEDRIMSEKREVVSVERSGIPTLIYKDEMKEGETIYEKKKASPKKVSSKKTDKKSK